MSRLIDADALRNSVKDIPMWGSVAAAMINAAPTLDAAPVVRGKWVDIGNISCRCSVCRELSSAYTSNYCPNCGAKMGRP